jgi:hypothetical protein
MSIKLWVSKYDGDIDKVCETEDESWSDRGYHWHNGDFDEADRYSVEQVDLVELLNLILKKGR